MLRNSNFELRCAARQGVGGALRAERSRRLLVVAWLPRLHRRVYVQPDQGLLSGSSQSASNVPLCWRTDGPRRSSLIAVRVDHEYHGLASGRRLPPRKQCCTDAPRNSRVAHLETASLQPF